MKALTNRLIVISFDCLSSSDYQLIRTLPNFRRVLNEGSYVQHVEAIYPSLTYPSHVSIVTGNYPKRHGVINNTLLQPGVSSPDWNWYRADIKGTTLYDEAYKANLTTAALLWPVTGKAKSIQYNLPEIFANRPWHTQIAVSLLNGTPAFLWDLNKRFGHIRNGLNQPELDDFVLECTIYTLQTKKPDLLLIHFTDLDTNRHQNGVFSSEATEAIHRHDKRLGRILDDLEERGELAETTVVVLGDHSALDENKAISPNVILYEENLITVNRKGKITDWKAYCKSCDGSAYIYLKHPVDAQTTKTVKDILTKLAADPSKGIEYVLTGEEAGRKGADPECAFMIEARSGYYFIEDYLGDYQKNVTAFDVRTNKKYMFGAHGYSPEKPNYTTFLMASGKGICPNRIIPYMHLTDIGPTLARLLGLDIGETDGNITEALLDIDNVQRGASYEKNVRA